MIEVRDYQTRIVERVLQAVAEGHRHILIESPTGSGKTIIGHLIAQKLHEQHGWKAGWTAMRRHLLVQAQEANHRLLGFPHIQYFSTFDSNPPGKLDVLFDDECQHSASETSTSLYKKINPKVVIGTTATPFRTDRMKLCYSRVIRDAGIRALIDAGWLSSFHQFVIPDEWTPQNVARIYLNDRQRWGKSVVYFLTLEECNQFTSILWAAGVRAEVVHANSDQEDQILRFQKGELDVLANVVVLTEGLDVPELRTVFVRPGSKGPTIQMTGRVLRRHPDKPFAQVVQNGASRWPFTKIASAERKFVYEDGAWCSRDSANEKIDRVAGNSLLAVATIRVTMPSYLIKHRTKRRRRAGFDGGPAAAHISGGNSSRHLLWLGETLYRRTQ